MLTAQERLTALCACALTAQLLTVFHQSDVHCYSDSVLSKQEPKSEWETPRVSPYRLAAHLSSAFVIYSGLLWTSLNMFFPISSAAQASSAAAAGAAALRKVTHPLAALIGITAVSGNACML